MHSEDPARRRPADGLREKAALREEPVDANLEPRLLIVVEKASHERASEGHERPGRIAAESVRLGGADRVLDPRALEGNGEIHVLRLSNPSPGL